MNENRFREVLDSLEKQGLIQRRIHPRYHADTWFGWKQCEAIEDENTFLFEILAKEGQL